MLVALGVGVGALICTDQGRHIIGKLANSSFAQNLGESAVNLLNGARPGGENAAAEGGTQSRVEHSPAAVGQAAEEQGGV